LKTPATEKQTEHNEKAYVPEQLFAVLPEAQLLSFVPHAVVVSGSFMRAAFSNHRHTRVKTRQPHQQTAAASTNDSRVAPRHNKDTSSTQTQVAHRHIDATAASQNACCHMLSYL